MIFESRTGLLWAVLFLVSLGAARTTTIAAERPAPSGSVPSKCERIAEDVYSVQDDAGHWVDGSMGITHQRGEKYWAKKVLDLSVVPDAIWNAATEVRLSAFFCARDYSWHDLKQGNGFDETIEIVVNGKVHEISNRRGVPQYIEGKSMTAAMRWHDVVLPKSELIRGVNEIIFRMQSPKGKAAADDYLYLGIDNSVPTRNSWVRMDPKASWRQDRLNAVGASGEYMVRLYLLHGKREFSAQWKPVASATDDSFHILDYAGVHDGDPRLEWNPLRLDPCRPLSLTVEISDSRPFEIHWLTADGDRLGQPVKAKGPRFETHLPLASVTVPAGVRFAKGSPLVNVNLKGERGFRPVPQSVNMAPRIEKPAGREANRRSVCRIDGDAIQLSNGNLRCEFRRKDGRLQLASLYNELAGAEMVRAPAECALALVEVDGKRYAASKDFLCGTVSSLPQRQGFRAVLACEAPRLELTLSVWIDTALHWGLSVTNRAIGAVDFKTAFPHLSGIAISPDPAGDYFFYPLGCVVSDAPALIRKGYGDHQALYQLMDVFSPKRGAGLAAWCTDTDGRYKVLALRKCVSGQPEISADQPTSPTAAEYKWTNSLESIPGTGMTWEYLRRTRGSGESFAPQDVALQAHAGDWHVAMCHYAEWCHTIWKFRPYPSRLTPLSTMLAVGWGKSPLVRDGKYRTDFCGPRTDCLELMSWWDWSTLGPKCIPIDEFEQKMPASKAQLWKSYFVKDPVTGVPMFNNNPGDYDGYNERFGGLAALREAVKTYRESCPLVTLYTDPFRVDYNTKCGRKWGELWGVVQPDGKYREDYDAWRMCHDVAEYRTFVAQNMVRALRETGADGVRLDEYGHAGSACFNKRHQHTFAEWGCTEWQRGVTEATKLVRQAMDEFDPRLVLTTEHPGYDFLMPYIDGCITYDLTVLASPLRPLECNLQRFYFPECKAYELDHRRADPTFAKRFWNAVGAFGGRYPDAMYRALRENQEVFSSHDCEPLVATLMPYVYANRFRSPDRTIVTLYNATGHALVAPLVCIDRHPGQHAVELLTGKEIECVAVDGRPAARLFLPRQGVACVTCLSDRMQVEHLGADLEVKVLSPAKGLRLVVCDGDGKALNEQTVEGLAIRLKRGEYPGPAVPASVRLLDGERLVDLRCWETNPSHGKL